MKNYIKISIVALSLVGLSSCDMDAPSISSLDESSVFSVYSLAESEIMSIHVSFGETNSYRGRFLPYYGINTDVEWINTPTYKDRLTDKYALANYNTTADNGQMNNATNAYAKFYEGIERANLAIKGLREFGNVQSRPEMAQLLGEALTLRAVVYNDLIKAWGDVPARFEPNNSENMYQGRTSRDVIYKQLLADLKEAEGRGRVLYTWGVRHQVEDQYTYQPRGGVNGPLPTLFYDYDKDDIRRDITCVPYRWGAKTDGTATSVNNNGINYNVYKVPQVISNPTSMYFGKLRYEWMNRYVTSTNDDGINWQYMRLADVYLMAAEAINELDGPAAAAQYMQPILDRALPADKVAALMAQYTANKEAFFKGIVDQRAFEFAGEVLRKPDLIRWGIIDEKMAEAKEKLRRLATRQGEYADLPEKVYVKLYEKDMVIPASAEVFDTPVDGETLVIYGLNHGDSDDTGKDMKDDGFESKGWFLSDGEARITDDIINGLYVVDKPSMNCLWPIWTYFIGNSNGMLNNDGIYGQLSD